MIKPYLEIGEIVGTHGVKGEMRVNPRCDGPEFFKGFQTLYFDDKGSQPVQVFSARVHGSLVLLMLAGVGTMEQAQALRGKLLYLRRSDARLKEGSYFIADLLGCEVRDADSGLVYGTLSEVSATGANDVWHVTTAQGREYLLPAIPDVVIEVRVEEAFVRIRPLKGIFDAD